MLGTTVAGRYEIEAQIGVGGMGIVYRAHDTRLRRDVALKVIAPHLMQQESARVRFLREAQALAGLMHPHIVTIFDMAEDADSNTVFLVMELLSGHSLREFLSDGTCPNTPDCPRFSDIALPLCRALEAAHKRGVLHRDIKPENIFVCDDGELKLMDFGLARLLGDMSKNQSSTVAGTLAYMAPEQLRGDKLDARTDLYALGAVFFEFVTGTQPFQGDNPGTVLLKHLTEPPPHLRDRLPVPLNADDEATLNALDDLITRLLAKEAGERPASAAEVRDALAQAQPGRDTLAFAVDRLLAAQDTRNAGAAYSMTQSMPPISIPTEAIAARLAPRQTTEMAQTSEPPAISALTLAGSPSQPVELLPENPPAPKVLPAWKRRGVVVAGIGLLSAASALAVVQFRPHSDTLTDAPGSVSASGKRQSVTAQGITVVRSAPPVSSGSSATAVPQSTPTPASAPSLVSKPGDAGHPPKSGGTVAAGENHAAANSSGVKSTQTALVPNVAPATTVSPDINKEREALRREKQAHQAEIARMKKELDAARARNASLDANQKANTPAVKQPVASGAKGGAKPVKLPPLPSVADEATPPLVIGLKVSPIERNDPKAVHISMQNDADCYAYFYLVSTRTRTAVRVFAGYENFPAAPKTPYTLQLVLPSGVSNNRGAILIVAAKKELKNLPASFELPPPQPRATAPNMTGEQRLQNSRQKIHQFNDQVAQQLAANHALQGGQLLQPHNVVLQYIEQNVIVFGRNPDRSRRNPNGVRTGPGQPFPRGRRNLPPPAEFGNTGATR